MSSTKKTTSLFSVFFHICPCPPACSFLHLLVIFQKWWNSTGFISIFASRVVFWSQKVPGDDALRMFVWNKDSYCFSTFGGPEKCLFSNVSFVWFSKNNSFHCLNRISGRPPFRQCFLTVLTKSQKCEFGAHPKYWKINWFYKHI